MSLLGRLLGLGVTATAAVIAYKAVKNYTDPQQTDETVYEPQGEAPLEDVFEQEEPAPFWEEQTPQAEFFGETAETVADAFTDAAKSAGQSIKDVAAKAGVDTDELADKVSDVFDDASKVASEAFTTAGENVRSAASKAGVNTEDVTTALREAGRAIVDAGKSVVDASGAVATKVVEQSPEVLGRMKTSADGIIHYVKDSVFPSTKTPTDTVPQDDETPLV